MHVHVETTESMHVASYELTHRGGFVEMMRMAKRFAAAGVRWEGPRRPHTTTCRDHTTTGERLPLSPLHDAPATERTPVFGLNRPSSSEQASRLGPRLERPLVPCC